ncbi:hypothetical protein SUGI_0830990 [Cryptomeria japonica]|nr:hypothetical protein SUGI_0830990 [Cryptomeria japonica]
MVGVWFGLDLVTNGTAPGRLQSYELELGFTDLRRGGESTPRHLPAFLSAVRIAPPPPRVEGLFSSSSLSSSRKC